VLAQVKNKRERSSPVRPPGVEKTSRLCSRDPMAFGVKCGSHGGMNSKMKSWTVSLLSLKTKVEPGLRGSRVMNGVRRRSPESSKRRTRVGIAWLALRLSRVRSPGMHPMEKT
jgi:hypothetical protein